MSTLDPRIEAVRKEYGLAADDFWQIKQNKQWVCKHAALEVVAFKAGIRFEAPMIIEAHGDQLLTSMVVTGHMGDRSAWATGETNATNYHIVGKQPAYPWAMSEKRAKDRVILKLVGIHGLVYSEDEADDFKQPEPRTTDQRSEQGRREVADQKTKADSRAPYTKFETAIRAAMSSKELQAVWGEIEDANIDAGFREQLVKEIDARLADLKTAHRPPAEVSPRESLNQQFGEAAA
jgi:hypothetical protein